MGENNWKWNNWQRLILQNIQASQSAQYQKTQLKKWAEDLNRYFSKEGIQMANKTHEKMLNITLYQKNANQNYSEVSPHTSQNGHHQKIYKQYMLERVWRKGNALALLVGMQVDNNHMEDDTEIPLKTRNKATIWPSNPTPRHILWGNQNWKRYMYPIVHCSTIYNS